MRYSDYAIMNDMRATLLADGRIKELIGEKISPIIIPGETEGDAVYYSSYGLKSEDTKHGIYSYSMHVAYSVVSDDCDRMNEIAWLIVEALSGEFETPNIRVSVEDKDEMSQDGKFIKSIDFLVTW